VAKQAARRHDGKSARDVESGQMPAGRPAVLPSSRRVAGHSLELDRTIHERVRLGIVSALAVNKTLSFNELKQLLGVTDGNLSVHARKLEEAGYDVIVFHATGSGGRAMEGLTGKGRDALERYLAHMEGLIRVTRGR